MKALSVVQLAKVLCDSHYNMVETLRQTGFATNGRFVFPLTKEVAAVVLKHADKRNKGNTKRVMPLERIQEVFEARHMARYNPIPEIAYVQARQEATDSAYANYTLASDSFVCKVCADYFDTIRKHCPGTFTIATKQPVAFVQDGKTVALLMPLVE